MNHELEVIWNGAHRGQNADLLMTVVEPARLADPHTQKEQTDVSAVRDFLRLEGPRTMAGIAMGLHWTLDRVNKVLYHLRRHGDVQIVGEGPLSTYGRRQWIYAASEKRV